MKNSTLVWHKIRLLHITQITEKIKHESCTIIICVCVKVGRTEIFFFFFFLFQFDKKEKLSYKRTNTTHKYFKVSGTNNRVKTPITVAHIVTGILDIFKPITALQSP